MDRTVLAVLLDHLLHHVVDRFQLVGVGVAPPSCRTAGSRGLCLACASAAWVIWILKPFDVMKSIVTSTLFLSAQALTCLFIVSFAVGTQWSQKPTVSLPAAPAVRICTSGSAAAATPIARRCDASRGAICSWRIHSLCGRGDAAAVLVRSGSSRVETRAEATCGGSSRRLADRPATRVRANYCRNPGSARGLSEAVQIDVRRSGSISCVPGRLQRTRERKCSEMDWPARCAGLRSACCLAAAATARADDANKTLKIGVVYDLTGPFAGGGSELHYLGAKIMIDWFNAHGGDRRLQDRGGLCRRAEQARRRDQRGGPPDRAGKGGHAARLLLLGRVRAGGGAHRAVQEVHVDHHLHRLAGAGGPPPANTCSGRSLTASNGA